MAKTPRYKERLTLFIDFMGFKELVDNSVTDPSLLPEIVWAMDRIAQIAEDDKQFHKSQRVAQFSDSVVVSYRVTEESAVFWLLTEIAFCLIELMERGFIVRGALTAGDLLHTKTRVVGPAMVEAYLLESTVAKVPRILVDEKVFQVAVNSRKPEHSPEQELKYVLDYLVKDADGRYYIDYISWDKVIRVAGGRDASYGRYLSRVHSVLSQGLSHEEAKVLKSYIWLYKHYNKERQRIAGLPADNPYRLQSPGVCAAVEQLPSLRQLARDAQAKVDSEERKRGSAKP